jgi:hypothetical protein
MTTTPIAPAAVPAAPAGAAPAAAVRAITFPAATLGFFAFGLAADLPDPILSLATLDDIIHKTTVLFTVGPIEVTMSVLACVGIYAASVLAPFVAGHAKAQLEAGAGSASVNRLLHAVFLTVWILLGFAMALIRLSDEMAGDTVAQRWPMALLMLILYVLGGLAVYHGSHDYFTSSWHLVRPVVKKAEKATAKADAAFALADHALVAYDTNQAQLTRWDSELTAHQKRLRAAEDQIKDLVRARLAAHLGNPAETALMFDEHKPSSDAA